MNKKNIVPLGYTMADGKLVENEFESEVLRFTFERNYYYYLNPPEELIEYFMTQDNTITREEAFELARNSAWIYYYISRDANEKFGDKIRVLAKQRCCTDELERQRKELQDFAASKGFVKTEPLVDRDIYEMVQQVLSKT